ncbi:hypothetical protein KFE25_001053 [Diacronema lutheri]|uniref:F-box domain-containing protein n=1 Tax=Diacronema lutheri TaxID=2081491 RepID=A0A8J5XIW7_DIALT|nr:hypothetical protein KFE25_001053 [Diacronema lutheri]
MLLATQDTTRLVVDLVDEDDALALALTCRTLRDAWAREHNCVWDAAALAEATEHGHAHVAAWAHAAGAPDQSVVYEAPALWGGLSAAVQRLMRADESDEDDDGRESEGEASHARAAQLARLIGLASASASRSGAR